MGRHDTAWEGFPKSCRKYHNKYHNTENVVESGNQPFAQKSLLKGSWITPINRLRRTANHSKISLDEEKTPDPKATAILQRIL